VAPPLLFRLYSFSTKRLILGGNGKDSISAKLGGNIRSDPKISLFVRLRTLAAAAFFWLLYFLLLKKE
jgi:hypothetical protein